MRMKEINRLGRENRTLLTPKFNRQIELELLMTVIGKEQPEGDQQKRAFLERQIVSHAAKR